MLQLWLLLIGRDLIGILGVVAIAVGVAGLRDGASKADAARRAERTQIQVFIPGQQQPPNSTTKEAPTSNGVDWPTWLAFEFGLIAAALSVEFQRAVRMFSTRLLRRALLTITDPRSIPHGVIEIVKVAPLSNAMTRSDLWGTAS